MNRFLIVALTLTLAVGAEVLSSHAAVISIQPVIAGYLDASTYDPLPPIPPGVNPGYPVIVQVDVTMEVVSLAPGEAGFAGAGFSFDLSSAGSSQIAEDGSGWHQNQRTFDTNGSLPGGQEPIFVEPAVIVPQPDGLKNILVTIKPTTPTHLGQPGSALGFPYELGTGFVLWDGLGEVYIKLDKVLVQARLTNGMFVSAQAAPSNVLVLGTVPEPSSLVMLGGVLVGVGLRHRV